MSGITRPLRLQPHPHDSNHPAVDISSRLSHQGTTLRVNYLLRGDLTLLDIPTAKAPPQRRDELWRQTCFELFITTPGENRYWEFNLSPSGDWACYRFTRYREQMTSVRDIHSLACEIRQNNQQLTLTADLPLSAAIATSAPLQIGITTVIRDHNGRCSYWALTHPTEQPDFHHRDGFALTVSPGKDHAAGTKPILSEQP